MNPQAELADLQNRFHLLEGDRKAFYEQSQLTLKQNKEICDTLRSENKDLRMALSSIIKERGSSETNAMQDAEAAKIETQLALLRKRQNQLQDANRTKEQAMSTLDDELRDLQRSSSRPAHEANPLMRQIRTLENRLDKAMIKYNEAQSIRKTYDQIVKRLKEERVNFGMLAC
jgi:chromosome segregation ATPase